jgi:DNA-binding HxlR family transcriptional regulator
MGPSSNLDLSAPPRGATTTSGQRAGEASCCPLYHEAIELVGKRWTGAIMHVLLFGGPLRFSEIAQAVPELSDRLLSERMKELEARGLVERRVLDGSPVRVQYALTPMGHDLGPALVEIKAWAHRWLTARHAAGPDARRHTL